MTDFGNNLVHVSLQVFIAGDVKIRCHQVVIAGGSKGNVTDFRNNLMQAKREV